ncbi:SDR family NAD(P)-dependent oxidoreductase [Microbacterium sp. MPKO10]|uniref:SDR family NAD(P)-dependent oxidoreductase n=1 Tax=Microbacterium sp. MPKO10 TaxID=2989818 RepID=UPI0022365114|nr:SDR family oxidoreductase [Microbacterium sp. MPKO10]MCW4457051.1 SDR family oxidoreductase [Microbacterium sp. MPKO10]
MDMQLAGKTALVTGASKGMGLEIVRVLREEGVAVAAASRAVTAELAETGVITLTGDLSDSEAPARIVAEAVTALGGLDILVNNVGGGAAAPGAGFLDFDDAAWSSTFDLNLYAAVRTTRAALPELLTSRGSVVTISSDSARRPQSAPLPYGAAKAALNAVMKGLSAEYGPQGVRINTITPSSTLTALWTGEQSFGAGLATAMNISNEELLATLPAQMGMITGRFIEPREIATAVAYLASPLADSVHGANWIIDAGVSETV